MSRTLRTLLAIAACTASCIAYRDRVVVVTQHTQIERNDSAAPVATAAPDDTLSLPLSPARLDAPTMRAALDGYGAWVESPAYGSVWIPDERARGADFTPYLTAGQWLPTRAGWYWQSEYPWGAIPFHYGRWVMIDGVWAWVPGSAFAPAWVDWRYGNGWAAWAPLAPWGSAFAASHMYCAFAHLRGSGLRARTVLGPAAASLHPYTAPLRVSCAYGATCYGAGPPVPQAAATDVAQAWAVSRATSRSAEARTIDSHTINPIGTPVEAPAVVPDVPRVPRVLNVATGTLRPLDAMPVRAQPSAALDVGVTTDVEPSPEESSPRIVITSAQAPAARVVASAVTAGSSGYTVIPARRMTWSSSAPIAPPSTTPLAEVAPRFQAPQRVEMPPVRAVSMPPVMGAPTFTTSSPVAWQAPPAYAAPPVRTYGPSFGSLPTTPSAAAASTLSRPSFAPPLSPSPPTVFAAPSTPVFAAPRYAAPPITAAPPIARAPSFSGAMSAPTMFAPGARLR